MNDFNKIYTHSSEQMSELPDGSVHLVITSPPYNVGKGYADYDDALPQDEYREMLRSVFSEVHRVLADGGRAAINIAGTGRNPYIPIHSFTVVDMLDLGFLMRGEIIWDKGNSARKLTSWGSWKSATNPCLRDVHEYILVFSKGKMGRKGGESTIERDEFMRDTESVWEIQAENSKKVSHPAPFPSSSPLG